MDGKFITVEGVEGVGKSTNMAFIEGFFADRGIKLLCTREPGGTPLAEELRAILLRRREEAVDVYAELLMVFAARAQHLNTVVKPALKEGCWVLCDRFTDATYAYQGMGRQMPMSFISQLEDSVQQGFQPDLTILLDLDVEVGLERARARADLDRFESEELAFFHRVRSGYQQRVAAAPERYSVIDAAPPIEVVQKNIAAALTKFMGS